MNDTSSNAQTKDPVVKGQLEDDETFVLTLSGYPSVFRWLTGVERGRVVVLTDRRVLVFQSTFWRPGKARRFLSAHPLDEVSMSVRGLALHLDDVRVVVHPHQRARAQAIVNQLS